MATRVTFRKLVLLTLTVLSLALPAIGWATPAGADNAGDLLTRVNGLRAGVGVAPLAADTTLTAIAQQWATHMASTGALAHNPSLATQAPGGWTKMGENIGQGYSIDAVYNALVASPDHYANMTDTSYNRSGVGVAVDSKGQVWMVQDFGAYPPPAGAKFVMPTNGSVIFSSPQPFSWNMAPGATYYGLTIGSAKGGYEFLSTGPISPNTLNYTVTALPSG